MSIESQHVKNEQLFCNGGKDIMVDMVVVRDVVGERKKGNLYNLLQFSSF
jgi:hypothetical protein